MARKLFNFCLAGAFLLGCWGGVLAAAVCPHLGCETAAGAPPRGATHGAHAGAGAREAAGHERHAGHRDHEGHEGHAAHAGARGGGAAEGLSGLVSAARGTSCAHCVGGPQSPPSLKSEWQFSSSRKAEKGAAPQFVRHLAAPARARATEITPSQHDPPEGPDRHLLHSVFRI